MLDDPVLECQDCGAVLRTLSPAEAQKVAANPYNYVLYCALCQDIGQDRSRGQCAGCFTMQDIRNGETKCDSCASTGSRAFEPEPYRKKSGPNSFPEE